MNWTSFVITVLTLLCGGTMKAFWDYLKQRSQANADVAVAESAEDVQTLRILRGEIRDLRKRVDSLELTLVVKSKEKHEAVERLQAAEVTLTQAALTGCEKGCGVAFDWFERKQGARSNG